MDEEKIKDVLRELVVDFHSNGVEYEYIAEELAEMAQGIIDEEFNE